MATLYRIAHWESLFETYETKKLAHLKWVPVPNKHDGLGFRRVAAQSNRCELFTAWNLILQIASKGKKSVDRGILQRDGRPISPDDFAMMTGFPAKIFETALVFFSSVELGWLEVVSAIEIQPPTDKPAEPPVKTAASPAQAPAEGNGMEGNRTEGKEGIKKTEAREEFLIDPPLGMPGNEDQAAFIGERSGVPRKQAVDYWNDLASHGWRDWNNVAVTDFGRHVKLRFDRKTNKDAERAAVAKSNPRPPSSIDIGNAIKAKEAIADAIRKKHTSEVATGTVWDDQSKRQEYFKLKKEARELLERQANLA